MSRRAAAGRQRADAPERPAAGQGGVHGCDQASQGASGSRGASGAMRLTLAYPPSTNHLYRNARAANGKTIRVKTQTAKAYQAHAERAVWAWHLEFGALPDPPYRLLIVLHPPTARRIDVSNGIKCLEDGVFAGMNRNDREVIEVRVRAAAIDAHNPRAEVTVEHVAPAREG